MEVIRAFPKPTPDRHEWPAITKVMQDSNDDLWIESGATVKVPCQLKKVALAARWAKTQDGHLIALLLPNGRSRTTAIQVMASGATLVIQYPPLPVLNS